MQGTYEKTEFKNICAVYIVDYDCKSLFTIFLNQENHTAFKDQY